MQLRSLLLVVVFAIAGCPRDERVITPLLPAPPPVAEQVELGGDTMGSTWHVRVRCNPDRVDAARQMQGPIDEALERINDEMSTYRPNSEISRFNAHASTAPFPVSKETALVVEKAIAIGEATGGAFDITIDRLINLWGFDRKGPITKTPSPSAVAEAKKHTGLSLLHVKDGALVKDDPALTINLGGIAAGFATDVVVDLLGAHGFADVMVEVTGEVRARGVNARGEPWRIGVKTPQKQEDGGVDVVTAVPLVDKALTTSGSYHNFFELDGKRYSHILDPTTGMPVQTDLVSVTVMAKDAVTADGYDTPFVLLGEEKARAILKKTPGVEALFIHQNAQGALTVTTTTGFPKANP